MIRVEATSEKDVRLFLVKVLCLTLVFLWCMIFFLPIHSPHSQRESTTDHTHDEDIVPWKSLDLSAISSISANDVQKDIATTAEQLLSNSIPREHGVADKKTHEYFLKKICTLYADVCDKTSREWDFSREEQLYYQLLMVYLIHHIDDRLIDWSVRQQLDHLKFMKDPNMKRWSAGHDYVKINTIKIDSWNEFREVLTHEFWHTVDLSILIWSSNRKHSLFTEFGNIIRPIDDPSIDYYRFSRQNENVRKKESSFKDFVSGYAMRSIYEDFAEHKNARFNHNAVFKKLARTSHTLQKKYDFFDDLYSGEYYRPNTDKANNLDLDAREWDTTKMRE